MSQSTQTTEHESAKPAHDTSLQEASGHSNFPTNLNKLSKEGQQVLRALLLAMTHRAFRVLAVTWPMCARIVQYHATSPSSLYVSRLIACAVRWKSAFPTTSLPWFISRLRSQPTLSPITFLHESVLELVMQAAHAPDLPMSGQVLNQVPDAKQRLSRALFDLNLKLASCKSGALVQVRAGGACLRASAIRSHPQLENPFHPWTAF